MDSSLDILTCNVVEKGCFGMALTCSLAFMYILRTGEGPSCSTSIAFESVGHVSRPRADHSRRRSSLHGRANWRLGAECPCARNREARRGLRLPASAACRSVCERVAALHHSARGRAGARNKSSNHQVHVLQDRGVLSGDSQCHETIFVPEQHNACWGGSVA
jgi:hypothetical protein